MLVHDHTKIPRIGKQQLIIQQEVDYKTSLAVSISNDKHSTKEQVNEAIQILMQFQLRASAHLSALQVFVDMGVKQ